MRFLFALLLALAIPFNAAYAAAAGICDGLQGHQQHGEHVGHHVHAHDHDDHDAPTHGDPQSSGSDHNHSHAHPLLSWMMPAQIGVHFPLTASAAPPPADTSFASAIPSRLERPPRHVRAA